MLLSVLSFRYAGYLGLGKTVNSIDITLLLAKNLVSIRYKSSILFKFFRGKLSLKLTKNTSGIGMKSPCCPDSLLDFLPACKTDGPIQSPAFPRIGLPKTDTFRFSDFYSIIN